MVQTSREDEQDRSRPEDVLTIGAPATGRSPPPPWWSWVLAHIRGRTRVAAFVLTAAVLLLTGAAVFIVGYLNGDDQDLTATRNQIRSLEQRERQDVVDADAADLDRVLATDFTLVTPDGQLLTRDDYLLAIASGDLDFRVFEPVSPIGIYTDGQQAVVTFSSRLDVSSGTTHLKHEAWHTNVWEKGHDGWQMVWSQTTATGGFPPPVASE